MLFYRWFTFIEGSYLPFKIITGCGILRSCDSNEMSESSGSMHGLIELCHLQFIAKRSSTLQFLSHHSSLAHNIVRASERIMTLILTLVRHGEVSILLRYMAMGLPC